MRPRPPGPQKRIWVSDKQGSGALMDFTRRHFCRMAGSAALAGYCSACSVNPATGDRNLLFLSAEEEKRIGAEEHPTILEEFGGAYDDPAVAASIAGNGSRRVAASGAPQPGLPVTMPTSPPET